MEKANTDQVVERACGVFRQLDENQLQLSQTINQYTCQRCLESSVFLLFDWEHLSWNFDQATTPWVRCTTS